MSLLAPLLLRADETEILGSPSDEIRLLPDGSAKDAQSLCLIRTTLSAGSDGPPPHCHRRAPEGFLMLDGRLDVLVDDDVRELRAGDLLVVPTGVPHAFATPVGSGAEFLF